MFGFKNLAFASAALLLAAGAAVAQTAAQTQAQILACQATIRTPSWAEFYNFDVSDTTPFTMTYTYDYNQCRTVPVISVNLNDYDIGAASACTFSQFTAAGTFTSVCQKTRGDLAQDSINKGGSADWSTWLRFGVRPTYILQEDIFTVVGEDATTTMISSTSATATSPTSTTAAATITPPATISEMTRRRRRAMETGEIVLSSATICDAGKTACPMRDRKYWFTKCIDTTSELYACGGCPGSAGAHDCSELKGVTDVECVRGTCQINQCDRSHKLSSDGRTCVRKEAYQNRSFW